MMAWNQIGLKAHGLCLQPLLEYGIPSGDVMDSMLKEINDQLEQNDRQLEECLKDLLHMANEVSQDKKFADPSDALNAMANLHSLDKTSCYDPESEDITRLLRHVLHTLDKYPGCEETMLQELLQLSSDQGMALPFRSSHTEDKTQSVLSINTVADQSEQLNESLWGDIRVRLRKYFIEKLNRLPTASTPPRISTRGQKRLVCLQSLGSLFNVEDVWATYKSIRAKQVDQCMGQHLQEQNEPLPFTKAAYQFELVTSHILLMINEDFEVLNSGIFAPVTSTFSALYEMYLERISDEASVIVDGLQDELSSIGQKDLPKSPSEFAGLSRKKVLLKKQHSKSLDSLLNQGEDQPFSDLQSVPKGHLYAVIAFITCLQCVESHMESLQNALTWEAFGAKKTKSRRRIKGVLKTTGSPERLKAPDSNAKQAFSPRSYEKSGLLPEAIPPPYGAMPATVTNSGGVVGKIGKQKSEENPKWAWRKLFRKLIPDIAKGMELHIREISQKSNELEDEELAKNGIIKAVQVNSDLVGGRLDYPKCISKATYDLMTELDKFLPLAKAGSEGNFIIMRSSFVDTVVINLKSVLLRFSKLTHDSQHKVSQGTFCLLLSSAAYIRNHLLHYETVLDLDDTGNDLQKLLVDVNTEKQDVDTEPIASLEKLLNLKKTFPHLYRQFCEMVDALSRQVIEYHNQLLCNSILHDAESHNYEDSREFYEGERCSYAIQMWYLHLSGMKHDLWEVCPPKLSQSILVAVLHESLTIFANRYARAKPSYKRFTQFRADITAILLCTCDLLFSACNSPNKYLDASMAQQPFYDIHNLCSSLLATMVVVSAPLEFVYKVYKKGFLKKNKRVEEEIPQGYPSHWICWLHPATFPLLQTSYALLQTTTAVYIQMKLLSSQPESNWMLVLQSILMKAYTLPIMLLTQAAEKYVPPKSKTTRQDSGQSEWGIESKQENVFQPIIEILLQCTSYTDAVAKVLIPVIERTETWNHFDTKVILGKNHPIPPWLWAIMKCLERFTTRICEPAIRLIMEKSDTSTQFPPLTETMQELPCGCEAKTAEEMGRPKIKDLLAEALYSLITQMVEDIYTLPGALCVFFKEVQECMKSHDIQPPNDCVGLKILATCIRTTLTDLEHIETLIGGHLSQHMKENLKMLAECSYHVLTATSYGKGSGTPRIAAMFMKANRNWLLEQIELLTDHLTNESFDMIDSQPLEAAPVEYTENMLMTLAGTILSLPTGVTAMAKASHFILNNKDWIIAQLDIPPIITSKDVPKQKHPEFTLSMSPHGHPNFNPMEAFIRIGNAKFDQEAIFEYHYDWMKLLQSDLGITEVNFRTLLYHRHEMQEGVYLEENEKKPVQVLKSRFDLEPADLV